MLESSEDGRNAFAGNVYQPHSYKSLQQIIHHIMCVLMSSTFINNRENYLNISLLPLKMDLIF